MQRVPGPVPVPFTPGTQGLDGDALPGAAKVSLQLLSQTVTNYNPFLRGEEHPVLQILTWIALGKPREVWPLRQLQCGSEDLSKGPVRFALASTPAAHPYHASTSRNPECVPPKSCCHVHRSRASSGNLRGGAELLSRRSPLTHAWLLSSSMP